MASFHIVGFSEWCDEAVELAKKWLQKTIDQCIPVEYQEQIKWIVKPPNPEDWSYTNGSVGWKYTPKEMLRKTLECDKLVEGEIVMPNVTQDVTLWMTDELHKVLTKVIMAKENHPRIYYILVIMKDGYEGPSAASENQESIDLSGKHVIHNRLVLMDNPPPVPMLSSSLWRIDNKIGEARCMYILPPDKPIMYGTEMGESSRFIWKSARGAPLVWSTNN